VVTIAVPDRDQQDDDLRLYRVKDAMRLLNLSRTVIYEQLRTGPRKCALSAGTTWTWRANPALIRPFRLMSSWSARCGPGRHQDTNVAACRRACPAGW
jgi:hypothetical protein